MDEKSEMEQETSQLVQCELIFSDMSEVRRFQLSQLTTYRQKLGTILENYPFGIFYAQPNLGTIPMLRQHIFGLFLTHPPTMSA